KDVQGNTVTTVTLAPFTSTVILSDEGTQNPDPDPEPKKYNVTIGTTAGGTVSGSGNFDEGSQVTVRATQNSGFRFVRWEENGQEVSKSSTYTFQISKDRVLLAVFQPITPGTGSLRVRMRAKIGGVPI